MIVARGVVGQTTTVTLTAYSDGTQTDQGTFTIGIVDANGDTLVSSGTAVTDNSDGTYDYTIAAQTEPNFLTVTWTESDSDPTYTTYVEIVGSVLFNENQLRAFDSSMLTSASTYPDSAILAAHDRVADYLEQRTDRSWIRRYCRVELAGSGKYDIHVTDGEARTSTGLPLYRPGRGRDVIRVLSATVDGTSVSTGNIEVLPSGVLKRTDSTWDKATTSTPYNVVIEYEYGQPYPVDRVDEISMMIARQWLAGSRIPGNAQSFTDSFGSYTFEETRLPWEAYHWVKQHKAGAFFG